MPIWLYMKKKGVSIFKKQLYVCGPYLTVAAAAGLHYTTYPYIDSSYNCTCMLPASVTSLHCSICPQ